MSLICSTFWSTIIFLFRIETFDIGNDKAPPPPQYDKGYQPYYIKLQGGLNNFWHGKVQGRILSRCPLLGPGIQVCCPPGGSPARLIEQQDTPISCGFQVTMTLLLYV